MSTSTTDPTAGAAMPGEEATSKEIAERTAEARALPVMPLMTDEEMRRTWRIALNLANSGMFKDAHKAEQAFAKILIGRDLGISPTQALMSIDLVKGAIQLRGVLLASFVRRSESYDYKVLEKTTTKARVQFLGFPTPEPWDESMVKHGGKFWEVLGEEEFTIEDAERAKLVKPDSGWVTHPKNMCFWRCISNGVKTHAPELLGGMPVYVEGEVDSASASYSHVPAQAQQSGAPAEMELPEEIAQLVARAHAIDPKEWRSTEVVARLPEPNTEGYTAALKALTTELKDWLAEHDPPDAVVVEELRHAGDVAEEAGLSGMATEGAPGNEPIDVAAALQQRWDNDEEWRAQVDPLLNRYADMEAVLDAAVGEDDEAQAEQARIHLGRLAGDLDALGVPTGWVPEGDGAGS